jgi:hypothetical protein
MRKNATFMDKIGIRERELKTAEHDALCKWVYYEKSSFDNFLSADLLKNKEEPYIEFKIPRNEFTSFFSIEYKELLWERDNFFKNLETICAFFGKNYFMVNKDNSLDCPFCATPLTILKVNYWPTRNNHYDDFVVSCFCENIKDHVKCIRQKVVFEHPLKVNGFYLGYCDLLFEFKLDVIGINGTNYPVFYRYYIEVKPKIESLGSVLRQINTYKDIVKRQEERYLQTRSFFVLITEDDLPCEDKEILKEQDILFISKRKSEESNNTPTKELLGKMKGDFE